MNIYIPIEIKVRELEGRTLLALTAAERGHTVILGAKNDTIGLAKRGSLPPGLVHMKSITPHDSMFDLLASLKENNHAITVQDEEGGLLDESYDTFAKLRFSNESILQVDRVCTWGRYDALSLKNFYPECEEKISVTGSPRVDFWRKDFAGYHNGENEKLLIHGKPYILIVSNFSGPLNENRFWNIMARLNEAGYFDREEGRERHEFENAAYQTRLIGEFVFMIRDLAKFFPDYNILVRPHPVESIEGWNKLIGNIPGVFVKREGTISKWIRNAELIIHNGCTSGLEAAISGENRIAYRPIPHEIEREIPNKVSINVFSFYELKDKVHAILNAEPMHKIYTNKSEIDKILNNRFAAIDGSLAADKIVDVWDIVAKEKNLVNSGTPEVLKKSLELRKPTIQQSVKQKLAGIKNNILGKSRETKRDNVLLKSAFKFPEFKEEELSEIKNNLERTLGRFKDVQFQRHGEKSFILYK